MSWLSKIFRIDSGDKSGGLSFGGKPIWEISCSKDLPLFLRGLKALCPPDSVLYIEGGVPFIEIQSYLEARKPAQIAAIDKGTIWPRPKCFHMLISEDSLEGLAQLAEKHCELEIACHVHVYKEGQLLLQWYDAFLDPLYVSKEIPEDRVKQFCGALGLKYS